MRSEVGNALPGDIGNWRGGSGAGRLKPRHGLSGAVASGEGCAGRWGSELLSVAKRRRIKIVVRGDTYFWQVQPRIPYDDFPWLVVLSSDKRLNFSYPLSRHHHPEFVQRCQSAGFDLPVPETETVPTEKNAEEWRQGRVSMFEITPRFVRQLIEWCIDNDCMTTP